jgi:hypothetical protein
MREYNKMDMKEEHSEELEEKDKKALFVHDVIVSYKSIYPLDLQPSKTMADIITVFKGEAKNSQFKEVICRSVHSLSLFNNLFWLYFCLKFQRQSYNELRSQYKQKIKQSYSELFYSLHNQNNKKTHTWLRKLPMIYSWAIIKKIVDTFKRSSAEFDRKLVTKCCQVVTFELQGLCVSETFCIKELNIMINDPYLFEFFPE